MEKNSLNLPSSAKLLEDHHQPLAQMKKVRHNDFNFNNNNNNNNSGRDQYYEEDLELVRQLQEKTKSLMDASSSAAYNMQNFVSDGIDCSATSTKEYDYLQKVQNQSDDYRSSPYTSFVFQK